MVPGTMVNCSPAVSSLGAVVFVERQPQGGGKTELQAMPFQQYHESCSHRPCTFKGCQLDVTLRVTAAMCYRAKLCHRSNEPAGAQARWFPRGPDHRQRLSHDGGLLNQGQAE